MHRGQLVYQAIKSKGFSFSFISKELGITRYHLYKCLKNKDMPLSTINKISNIIHYDFRESIPELYDRTDSIENIPYEDKANSQAKIIKIKYSNLVNHYNSLLKFLLDLANNYDIKDLKNEIKDHLKE